MYIHHYTITSHHITLHYITSHYIYTTLHTTHIRYLFLISDPDMLKGFFQNLSPRLAKISHCDSRGRGVSHLKGLQLPQVIFGEVTVTNRITVIEKQMAKSPYISSLNLGPYTNLPLGSCAIFFDLKVLHFQARGSQPISSWLPWRKGATPNMYSKSAKIKRQGWVVSLTALCIHPWFFSAGVLGWDSDGIFSPVDTHQIQGFFWGGFPSKLPENSLGR